MSKELKVEYADIKPKIEIRATIIKPEEIIKEKYNRAKKKEEDRKLAEEYIDRQGVITNEYDNTRNKTTKF